MIQESQPQWVVDEDGLVSVVPPAPFEYYIEASRLLEKHGTGEEEIYDWPFHMAEKTWIDLEGFIAAYLQALKAHEGKYQGKVDDGVLDRSLQLARERLRLWQESKSVDDLFRPPE